MNLDQTLAKVAADLDLKASDLISFAREDDIGGWEIKESERLWPVGSIFGDEGKMLYALIRAMRPSVIIEVGVRYGCSTKHILAALVKNRRGKLISYDILNMHSSKRFTEAQLKRWEFKQENVLGAVFPGQIDILFEDGSHEAEETKNIVRMGMAHGAKLILSHDAEHFLVGEAVRRGFDEATDGNFKTVIIDNTECGFAYWIGEHESD